jgi:hypothetical protein
MRSRRFASLLFLFDLALLAGACGSRTGLGLDDEPIAEEDSGADVSLFDGGKDARDATEEDATEEDALPPIDARPRPDVRRDDCPDADATLVYLVSETFDLLSFYPPTATFTTIGKIKCPSASTPFSMGVDRKGKAYVVFDDGNLFEVSTATAACVATPFVVGQNGFVTFGMGFVSDNGGPAEKLYVAENELTGNQLSRGLATIDTDAGTFKLNFISNFNPSEPRMELTGTGDGRLFGYFPNVSGAGAHIIEIDKTTAQVLGDDALLIGSPGDAFAFAYWGGDFWVFHGSTSTTVTRFSPSDKSSTNVTTAPSVIVGAGVSTCAPQ